MAQRLALCKPDQQSLKRLHNISACNCTVPASGHVWRCRLRMPDSPQLGLHLHRQSTDRLAPAVSVGALESSPRRSYSALQKVTSCPLDPLLWAAGTRMRPAPCTSHPAAPTSSTHSACKASAPHDAAVSEYIWLKQACRAVGHWRSGV